MKSGIYMNDQDQIVLVYEKQDMAFNNFEVRAKSFYIQVTDDEFKKGRFKQQAKWLRDNKFIRVMSLPTGVERKMYGWSFLRGY